MSKTKQTAKKPQGNAAKNKSENSAGKRNAQTSAAGKATPNPPPEETHEQRLSIIRLIIAWIKAMISYKKGERDEFRYSYDEEHPNYCIQEKNGKITSFGVTHRETTFGVKNMPLEQNPEQGKTKQSFIRNGVVTGKKKRYGGRMKNFRLSPADRANVKSKKRNYKKVSKQQRKRNKKSK